MIVTWTVLRTSRPTPDVPWQPDGAAWWQAGPTGPGRAEPPAPGGRWWCVLATWPDRAAAAGPAPRDGVAVWHVVLEAAAYRGGAALAGGARPFDDLRPDADVEGAAAVVTLAQPATDAAREREFFRRFLHLGRGVGQAPGHLASMVQAPADGAVLTCSAWRDLGSALDWAYASPQHAGAVARQRSHGLVEASGFLRCAVLASAGALGDVPDPLAGHTGRVVRQRVDGAAAPT